PGSWSTGTVSLDERSHAHRALGAPPARRHGRRESRANRLTGGLRGLARGSATAPPATHQSSGLSSALSTSPDVDGATAAPTSSYAAGGPPSRRGGIGSGSVRISYIC